MLDFVDLLPFALFFLVIGIIAITFWVASMIFKARYSKMAEESGGGKATALSAAPRQTHLLAVSHAPNGAWRITVNGEHYPNLEAVPNDAVRQDVVAGLKEVVTFARSYVAQQEQAGKKPATPPQAPHAVATEVSAIPKALEPAPAMPEILIAPPAQPTPPAPPAATLTAPPAASPLTDRLRTLRKDEPELKRPGAAPVLMPILNLAQEIGEIVAEMQTRIPSLAQRSIKLQDAPGGGVQFAIDGKVYSDVSEIPDTEVQGLIRAATKEWERR